MVDVVRHFPTEIRVALVMFGVEVNLQTINWSASFTVSFEELAREYSSRENAKFAAKHLRDAADLLDQGKGNG